MALPEEAPLRADLWFLAATQLMVPALLLWLGHGYRDRSPASKRLFWGGVVGYVAAIVVGTTLLVLPPVFWGANGGLRWLAIQWTPLVLPFAAVIATRLLSEGG